MSEENKAVVRRYVDEVMNGKNFSVFNDLFSPDLANHSPRLGVVGREYTAQETQEFMTSFPDWHTTIDHMVAEGDKVVVVRSVRGTHEGQVQGVPIGPTGKQITWTVWDMFRISNGQIAERWGIHNLRDQVEAAGRV